jgi:hypothetical protein
MSDYVVERSTSIAASPEVVFGRVGNLQGWDDWSPWAEMDPDMNKTYSGEPGSVGSKYQWTGNRKVGEGQMVINSVDAPTKIGIDLSFLKPFKSESLTEMMVSPSGDGSTVIWRMTGETTFIVKVMGLFGRSMDKMVGPDFEKGLAKLKRITES